MNQTNNEETVKMSVKSFPKALKVQSGTWKKMISWGVSKSQFEGN